MSRLFVSMFFLICFSGVFGLKPTQFRFYVGTYTTEGGKGIVLCTFNPDNGEIGIIDSVKNISNPSFLKISPGNRFLYAVSEVGDRSQKDNGFVSAFKILPDGRLEFLNRQPSMGNGPCHVDVSKNGKFVAVANYGGGTIAMFAVNDDGSLQQASSHIINSGKGPDKNRQTSPHAHSIKFSPFTEEVFSTDLGTDHFDIYQLAGNKLVKSAQPFLMMDPGTGPRHFDFHPNGEYIYVINELNSTVTTLLKVNGKWEKQQSISTLPEGYTEKSYCADVHVSPDGKFLYGSNRGHNSITIFEINRNDGKLKMTGTVPVEGNWPRNFSLSPDGKYLLVANQRSDNITVFKINANSGIPEFTGKQIQLKSPVCIEFVK